MTIPYRKAAVVEPDPPPPPIRKSLAEEAKERVLQYQAAKSAAAANIASDRKLRRMYKQIVKEIYYQSKIGNTYLYWSDQSFWANDWVSRATAEALCKLLRVEKFNTNPDPVTDHPDRYHIFVSWGF